MSLMYKLFNNSESNMADSKHQLIFCPLCREPYSSMQDLSLHVSAIHISGPILEKDYNHICPKCTQGFQTKKELKKHKHTHTDDSDLKYSSCKCSQCEYRSSSKRGMKKHTKQEHGR